jgi:hypothetical protein
MKIKVVIACLFVLFFNCTKPSANTDNDWDLFSAVANGDVEKTRELITRYSFNPGLSFDLQGQSYFLLDTAIELENRDLFNTLLENKLYPSNDDQFRLALAQSTLISSDDYFFDKVFNKQPLKGLFTNNLDLLIESTKAGNSDA